MDRPAPGLKLEAITPPRQDIMRIWRTLRPMDHAFIRGIIEDVVMFAETPVDWIFLRTATEFWDPEHVVFNFQGTELAPTIEEYTELIQRPTPTTHGIFMPNPFTTVQSQLSTLLRIPALDIHEELHQRTFPPKRTAYLSVSNGPTLHPRPLQDSYRFGRFAANGMLAPYSLCTSPNTPPTKSEHSPPHQHTWLGSTRRDRHHHNGPRPPRLLELHLPLLPKPKVPSKQPCTQSYGPSRRNEIGSVASLSIPVQRSRITGSSRRS
ncbi:hypothetical protein CRG98_018887 [Punica granatum]|uniref:DUF7745 domain-containing protein n=1 Tax=Punica granatum TaxID=22663 RepID=A0A2I0JZ50_PUNGR|nr:hypothetical protein CRG98_018887 [Punica granatum]